VNFTHNSTGAPRFGRPWRLRNLQPATTAAGQPGVPLRALAKACD